MVYITRLFAIILHLLNDYRDERESDIFSVGVGLRLGWAMAPLLFVNSVDRISGVEIVQ